MMPGHEKSDPAIVAKKPNPASTETADKGGGGALPPANAIVPASASIEASSDKDAVRRYHCFHQTYVTYAKLTAAKHMIIIK